MSDSAEIRRELAALRAGRERRRAEVRRFPWLASDLRRMQEEIQRLERALTASGRGRTHYQARGGARP